MSDPIAYRKDDPTGEKTRADYEAMMREGSARFIWRIMEAQAEREGPDAIKRFQIMQEFGV
jgi:hypothetical protein